MVQDIVLHATADPLPTRALGHAGWNDGVGCLPAGVNRHFGPELRRFVLMHYHQRQVTVPGWWHNCGALALPSPSGG